MTDAALPDFRWLGHGTIYVPGSPRVAVDPWKWRYDDLVADLILVTCGHVDHCCEDDLRRASHAETVAVGPASAQRPMSNVFGDRVRILEMGESMPFGDATIRALPHAGRATDDRPDGFHPRGMGLSFLLESAAGTLLFLGDSVALEEHHGLAPDVAFLGISGMVAMTPEDAATGAAAIVPGLAVPIGWGDLHGRYPHAQRFVDACERLGVRAAVATAADV